MGRPKYPWPDGHRAAVAITFDVDAETGVLGDYPQASSRLSVMTHQAYGPRSGVPRILRILERHAVRPRSSFPG
jgi:peptidoglycan-N-acetylglucosamine deacetylase